MPALALAAVNAMHSLQARIASGTGPSWLPEPILCCRSAPAILLLLLLLLLRCCRRRRLLLEIGAPDADCAVLAA